MTNINSHLMSSFPPLVFLIKICSPSSRRQTTLGGGCPVALQTNVASSPSCTAISVDDSSLMMSGGTKKNTYLCEKRRKTYKI